MKRIMELIISGEVQGVFFRQGAKKKADGLSISGFVKNQEDGSVKIITEGEEEKLHKFIEWCRKGTEFSKVKDVKTKWLDNGQEFKDFQIL